MYRLGAGKIKKYNTGTAGYSVGKWETKDANRWAGRHGTLIAGIHGVQPQIKWALEKGKRIPEKSQKDSQERSGEDWN